MMQESGATYVAPSRVATRERTRACRDASRTRSSPGGPTPSCVCSTRRSPLSTGRAAVAGAQRGDVLQPTCPCQVPRRSPAHGDGAVLPAMDWCVSSSLGTTLPLRRRAHRGRARLPEPAPNLHDAAPRGNPRAAAPSAPPRPLAPASWSGALGHEPARVGVQRAQGGPPVRADLDESEHCPACGPQFRAELGRRAQRHLP